MLRVSRVSAVAAAAAAAAAPRRRVVDLRATLLTVASPSRSKLPPIKNEPFLHYAPGSSERSKLKDELARLREAEAVEIPCVVGGKEIRTGKMDTQVMPSDHKRVVASYHCADAAVTREAIAAALAAKEKWEALPSEDRASVFLKAADLLSTKYRAKVCAASMLGASKNVWQAEIDAAVETIDFWRFNARYAEEIYAAQPPEHSPTTWNRMEYRPLEGFVLAITPFNFLAIGSNLPSTPAQMGNVVLWKPSGTNMLANWHVFNILREAGLPDGVINFLPGRGAPVSDACFESRDFAGLHFTGSTPTFNALWKKMAAHIDTYRTYPRMVGETGGKNFHLVHESADIPSAVHHTVRAAFEYQGQKCSACSRLYVPDNVWPEFKKLLLEDIASIKMGQPDEMDSFMCAVIDKKAFTKIGEYISDAAASPKCEIIAGGKSDGSRGYFVQPTVIVTSDPHYVTMREEIFGPVLTVYVYPHNQFEATLRLCDETAAYGLTGAIFARDRYAIHRAASALRNAAGNFYINDKCTGAIVGQQPFGGARASGTNDKSGSFLNLLRWVSCRSIKETFVPQPKIGYPHMNEPSR